MGHHGGPLPGNGADGLKTATPTLLNMYSLTPRVSRRDFTIPQRRSPTHLSCGFLVWTERNSQCLLRSSLFFKVS